MKRYLLFKGSIYARGGWEDFEGDFETVEEIMELELHPQFIHVDWAHIVDSETGDVVKNWDENGWRS